MLYVCPIKGCPNTLTGVTIPFCGEHWNALKQETRVAITEARKVSVFAEKSAVLAAIRELQGK